jgi:hypothetical protein
MIAVRAGSPGADYRDHAVAAAVTQPLFDGARRASLRGLVVHEDRSREWADHSHAQRRTRCCVRGGRCADIWNTLSKLGVDNRSQAAVKAVEDGSLVESTGERRRRR